MANDPNTIAVAQAAQQIALQMLEERGRGAVLVGVARVDAALEHMLQAVMQPPAREVDSLFQPDRPLGSLGAKVMLASRLGLIDTEVERSLSALRKLRNSFAHSAGSASLSDPSHSPKLIGSYEAARLSPLWTPLEAILKAKAASTNGPLEPALRDYILLITILVALLEATTQKLKPMMPTSSISFKG